MKIPKNWKIIHRKNSLPIFWIFQNKSKRPHNRWAKTQFRRIFAFNQNKLNEEEEEGRVVSKLSPFLCSPENRVFLELSPKICVKMYGKSDKNVRCMLWYGEKGVTSRKSARKVTRKVWVPHTQNFIFSYTQKNPYTQFLYKFCDFSRDFWANLREIQ